MVPKPHILMRGGIVPSRQTDNSCNVFAALRREGANADHGGPRRDPTAPQNRLLAGGSQNNEVAVFGDVFSGGRHEHPLAEFRATLRTAAPPHYPAEVVTASERFEVAAGLYAGADDAKPGGLGSQMTCG